MTTKKFFIKAAKAICEVNDLTENTLLCNKFISIFEEENPRFDAAKFSKACGL